MNKSIALIGGAGFIGTNLANFFTEKDYNVLVIGRSVIEDRKFASHKIEKKIIDVNITSKLVDSLAEYENIVWLVNDLVPGASMDSLVDDFTFNVSPLINFLEAINTLKNLKRFVFISSGGTIYGDSPNKVNLNEDSPKKPISAYGLSKIISENYIEYITNRSSIQSIILRPSNVYGNHQNLKKPQGIVGYAFNALINKKTIDLYDGGKMTRDFIHVLDLAEAIKCCVENKYVKSKTETYNIGSQEGITIREVLDLINNISEKRLHTIEKPARLFDCDYNVLNSNRIRSELAWEPKIKLEDGLNQVWQWLKSETKLD